MSMNQHTAGVHFFAHCWVEVDLDCLYNNYHSVRTALSDDVKIMGIVKADAYGHGAHAVASQLIEHGIDYLGVSLPEEAIQLRRAGIQKPILVLSPVLDEWFPALVENGITLSVSNMQSAEKLADIAENMGRVCPVHFEVDTGMGRYGADAASAAAVIRSMAALPSLQIEGVFTHFAAAADNSAFTKNQLQLFRSVLQEIGPDVSVPLIHAANSAAMVNHPDAHFNMVRIGSLLYGQDITGSKKMNLQPVWSMKAKIIQVRTLPAGSNIGYGDDVRLKRSTKVGVIPVGFVDGLLVRTIERPYTLREALRLAVRHLAFYFGVERVQEYVQFRDVKTPVLGRVGMQHLCIDLTAHTDPVPGEIVTLSARKAGVHPGIPKVYKWKDQWFPAKDTLFTELARDECPADNEGRAEMKEVCSENDPCGETDRKDD